MRGEYTYLGWMAATVENSLSHIGLPKKVLCFRPVRMSVALSKFNAAWPAWSQRNKKLEKEGPDSCLFPQPLLNLMWGWEQVGNHTHKSISNQHTLSFVWHSACIASNMGISVLFELTMLLSHPVRKRWKFRNPTLPNSSISCSREAKRSLNQAKAPVSLQIQ